MSKLYDENDDNQDFEDQSSNDFNYRSNIFVDTVETKTFIDKKQQANKINRVKEVTLFNISLILKLNLVR